MLYILLKELVCNDVHVSHWVDLTLVMHDILIGESSHYMVDSIHGLDVRQKGIAKTLTLTGSGNESSDVKDGN